MDQKNPSQREIASLREKNHRPETGKPEAESRLRHLEGIFSQNNDGKENNRELCFFKHLVETSNDPFYIISPAEGYRLIYVNPAACHHLGRSQEELLGMSIPDWDPVYSMDQISQMWERLKQDKSFIFETLHRHADGHEIPVEVSANYFVYDQQELFGGWFRNISARKEAEDRLRTLAAVVEKSNDFIGLCEPDLMPFFLNEAGRRMVGLDSMEEARNIPVIDFFWPEDRPRFENHILPEFLAKGRWTGELRLRNFKTNSSLNVLWSAFRIDDPGKRTETWATICMDLTRTKQLEQEKISAEAANQAKSAFLANMSHEIRTPMTIFISALDHLLKIDQDPARREMLDIADNSARKLRFLIDDVLDFSRIEAQRVALQEKPFNLRDGVRSIVEFMAFSAKEKNLRFNWSVSADVPEVILGDPDRLEQILTNLVGNAIKFTDEGTIEVDVKRIDADLHFSVSDTGIGIPSEKRPRLFQTFSQLDNSLTRKRGGTGLGLAICKGLVDLMGGDIWVDDRDGGGSVFHFTLPGKGKSVERVFDHPGSAARGEHNASAARILVIEDEPAIRQLIQVLLAPKGCRVVCAESGPEGIKKWQEGIFDLILMDIQMPQMSGIEATKKIRHLEKERGTHTFIAGLTAHARQEIMEECLSAGMDDFLTKPIEIDEMNTVVEKSITRTDSH